MPASKNSASSLISSAILLAVLSCTAAWFVYSRGYTLYYGDAEAHLNIARRVFDSRTPQWEQIGTVWLPLPHLVMMPFLRSLRLWTTGLAGVIPSAASFVVAGVALFAASRRAFQSASAGFASVLVFALNPNLLYLQSTPMTEALFLAGFLALLWATLWFRDGQSWWAILAAGIAANIAAMTRYEGWFLIPFAAVYLLAVARTKGKAGVFLAVAMIGPISWLVYNQYCYSNALEFFNGPYSAAMIYKRGLAQGQMPYPGDHDWLKAIRYYLEAARLVVGIPVLAMGAAGVLFAFTRRVFWPVFFLALVPAFYVWSMHSSGTPIFIPTLFPFSWYNTRYAIGILPLAAFAAGALAVMIPQRIRSIAVLGIGLLPVGFYSFNNPLSICWKESVANSEARRDWTHQAAQYLAANYQPGSGIAIPFGDLTGILREAGIPMKESLHEGNHPAWEASIARPDLFLREQWAVAYAGDPLSTAIAQADRQGVHYQLRTQIRVKGAQVVEIYQRRQ